MWNQQNYLQLQSRRNLYIKGSHIMKNIETVIFKNFPLQIFKCIKDFTYNPISDQAILLSARTLMIIISLLVIDTYCKDGKKWRFGRLNMLSWKSPKQQDGPICYSLTKYCLRYAIGKARHTWSKVYQTFIVFVTFLDSVISR